MNFFHGINTKIINFKNENGLLKRHKCADMIEYLDQDLSDGMLVIFDGMNSTNKKRRWIMETLKNKNYKIIKRSKVPNTNYKSIVDNNSYIEHYVKTYNNKRCITTNKLSEYIASKIVNFKTIYLSRHGQSEYNEKGLIGGNSHLTKCGIDYSKKLGKYLESEGLFKNDTQVQLWTSSLTRTNETLQYVINNLDFLKTRHKIFPNLDEINAGICNEMTYEQIAEKYPDEFAARKKNKLTYRYPNGESYLDLIQRIEPIIHKLEDSENPVVIISHNAIIRLLVGFYKGIPRTECPFIEIPLHTVIKISSGCNGYDICFIDLDKIM